VSGRAQHAAALDPAASRRARHHVKVIHRVLVHRRVASELQLIVLGEMRAAAKRS
jgi:hypothetical protein